MKSVSRVGLVDLQVKRRLRELLATSYEHAALTHQAAHMASWSEVPGGRKRRTSSVALARNGMAPVLTKLVSTLLGRTFSQAKMRTTIFCIATSRQNDTPDKDKP